MKLSYNLGKLLTDRYIARDGQDKEPLNGTFITHGNAELLSQKKLAVFASHSSPEMNFLEIVKLFNCLKNQKIALAGGWHSSLERSLFMTADQSDKANYLYYVAKDLNSYRFNKQQQMLIEAEKLLMIGHDKPKHRIDKISSKWRNQLILSQMDTVLFIYIRPEGFLHSCFEQLLSDGNRIFIFDIPENKPFIVSGVIPLNRENMKEVLFL